MRPKQELKDENKSRTEDTHWLQCSQSEVTHGVILSSKHTGKEVFFLFSWGGERTLSTNRNIG